MNAGVRRQELPRTRAMSRSRGLVLGGIWLRCTTRCRARHLDRQLAAGADPMQSDDLSLRVAAPPIRRAAVRASGGLLLEIAERLVSCQPVGVRGVAIASQLLEDRRGPLYRDDAARLLTVTAFEALVALDSGLRTISASDR